MGEIIVYMRGRVFSYISLIFLLIHCRGRAVAQNLYGYSIHTYIVYPKIMGMQM